MLWSGLEACVSYLDVSYLFSCSAARQLVAAVGKSDAFISFPSLLNMNSANDVGNSTQPASDFGVCTLLERPLVSLYNGHIAMQERNGFRYPGAGSLKLSRHISQRKSQSWKSR